PQSGKGNCDRMAAVIKCNLRRYIDKKHNVTNSKEFIEAARETKNLSSYRCSISPNYTQSKKKVEWEGVKEFNNLEYFKTTVPIPVQKKFVNEKLEHMSVKCWRAWNIGVGKTFMWKNVQEVTSIFPLKIIDEFSITNNQWLLEPEQDG
ncbi:unnamed protein product, partial [Rotaria sp. Silwood2]